MARIHLTLLSVLLYCVTYIYASTVNSIAGPVAQGATVYITYQITPTPPPGNVTLQVINFTTKDTKVISDNLPLNPPSFKWVVDVAVGTYYLALNDGSGQVFSGNFDVSAGTLPPSTSSAAAAPTPAPAPAPSPPAPAASATTPAASTPAAAPAASSSAATSPSATAKPSAANSAPSFSGYSLLISLAVVAAVMFHMA